MTTEERDKKLQEIKEFYKDDRVDMSGSYPVWLLSEVERLEAKLERAVVVIENLLNSECIKEAPFLSYSESYTKAREYLTSVKKE